MTNDAPERHNDTERNKALNLAVTKLDAIINYYDPEIDAPINDGVWNVIDRLCDSLEKLAYARAIEDALNKVTGCDRVSEVGPAIRALAEQEGEA